MNVDWIQLGLVRARANGRIGGGRYKLSTMQQAEGNQDDSAWREEFAHGDIQGALAVFTDDILWHVPGRGPLSRDYRGRDEVLGFLQHFMELSRGTFRIQVDDILAKGDRVVVLCAESAQRGNRSWSSPQVHV